MQSGETRYRRVEGVCKAQLSCFGGKFWLTIECEAVGDAVFRSTLSQDTGLPHIICQACIHHFPGLEIVNYARHRPIILGNEELAHALLKHAMREETNDMVLRDGALAKRISLQDELLATKGAVRLPHGQKKKGQVVLQQIFARAKAETHLALDQRNTTLSRFNALANNVIRGKNAGTVVMTFRSWIERLGSSYDPQLQLRCSNCRCRYAV